MKTSEFKKRVMELNLGVEVIETSNSITVRAMYSELIKAIVSAVSEDTLMLNTTNIKLMKLCIKYAETPIEEREEEKKYTVVLPDPRNDGTHCQALYKGLYGICIGYVYRYDLEGFTEAEIKRNHEYLWQFAKEV